MEVLLEAHGLWEVIEAESLTKKNCQALSILLRVILEEIQMQLNIKRHVKEIWETLKSKIVGIEHM